MRLKNEDSFLNIRVPSDVKNRVEFLADQMWCSCSDVVRKAIRQHLLDNQDIFDSEPAYHSDKY
jgi:predicted transcriptional regulator